MFLLAIQIPFLQLIEKTEQEWCAAFFEEIQEWVHQFGFFFYQIKRDTLFFTCDDLTLRNTRNITKILSKLPPFFEKWSEEIDGYTVLVDYQAEFSASLIEDLFSYLLRITEFNYIWLTSTATTLLDNVSVSNGMFLHKFSELSLSEKNHPVHQFFAAKKTLAPLQHSITQQSTVQSQKMLLFRTDRFSGFDVTLAELLRNSNSWYWWMFCDDTRDVTNPFQRFFLNYDISEIHISRNEEEERLYQTITRIQHHGRYMFPENPWQDIQEGFQYVLNRQLELHEHSPGIIVLEWMEQWPLESLEYLFQAVKDASILLIAFCETAILPLPQHIPVMHDYFMPERVLPADLPEWMTRSSANISPLILYNLMLWHQVQRLSTMPPVDQSTWPHIMTHHLSLLSLQVLYIISVLGDRVNNVDLVEIIQREKVDALNIVLTLRNLVEMGFLFRGDNSHLGFHLSREEIGPLLGSNRQACDECIANHAYTAILDGRWPPSPKLFWAVAHQLSHEQYILVVLLTTHYLLDCLQNPQGFLQQVWLHCHMNALCQLVEVMQLVMRIEWKLISGKEVSEWDNGRLFQIDQKELPQVLSAVVNTTCARTALYQRNTIVATSHAKAVLALPLSPVIVRLHGLCYGVLGTLAMLRGMYREATDYFLFVGNMPNRQHLFLAQAMANIYLCSCYFITGQLSQLQDQVLVNQQESIQNGQHHWQQVYTFILARSMFELGYYKEAHALLKTERQVLPEFAPMFGLWEGRALAYLGSPLAAVEKMLTYPLSVERALFLGEAYVLLQDYSKATAVLEKGIALLEHTPTIGAPPLAIPGGFFVLEGLIPEIAVRELSRLLYLWYAYALSHEGKTQEALEVIAPFILQNRESGGGPYDPLIYLLSAEIFLRSGQAEQKSIAYISKGIVVLKERASLLQKVQLKDQYLLHHHWHSRLMRKAKEHYIT